MKVLEAELMTADVQVASILGLPFGADIASFKILGFASGMPYVIFYFYLPAELGKEAIDLVYQYEAKNSWFSFTRYYREHKRLDLGTARQTFEAVAASAEQSRLMQLAEGSALFKVTSIIFARQENPIELRRAYYRGDRYKFNISRDVIS